MAFNIKFNFEALISYLCTTLFTIYFSLSVDDEVHGHFENGDDAEYLSKSYGLTPDAMGRYTCDECGKIFKHPGSLQHHRHIHRGTHRCPSCGKVFSRRWDMERHLNKSKYGCPANRFSTGN